MKNRTWINITSILLLIPLIIIYFTFWIINYILLYSTAGLSFFAFTIMTQFYIYIIYWIMYIITKSKFYNK